MGCNCSKFRYYKIAVADLTADIVDHATGTKSPRLRKTADGLHCMLKYYATEVPPDLAALGLQAYSHADARTEVNGSAWGDRVALGL
jgi:hypothetical protein